MKDHDTELIPHYFSDDDNGGSSETGIFTRPKMHRSDPRIDQLRARSVDLNKIPEPKSDIERKRLEWERNTVNATLSALDLAQKMKKGRR